MKKTLWTAAGIGAGVGALTLGAVTFASAQNTPAPISTSQSQQIHHGPGPHETPLTGEDAEKATTAAQAEIPDGTVLRVETDADGTYEAHVRKADGTEVIVTMDADFAVTGVEEFTPRKGHHGPGPHETPLTGEDAEKATAAVKARFPKATIIRLETDPDGAYEAHIVKANGTVVGVTMNKSFRITDVERFSFGRGHMHPRPAPTDTTTSAA